MVTGGSSATVEQFAGYAMETETVASGEQTISFTQAFAEDASIAFTQLPLRGLTAEGDSIDIYPYDLTVTGFKVNADIGCTFSYTVMIKR